MQDIPPIEPIPKLSGFCKIAALLLTSLFYIVPFLFGLWFWLSYDDILISIGIFLFLQIASGVLAAKMRTSYAPLDQLEISYTTYEIVSWYVYFEFCPHQTKHKNKETSLKLVTDKKSPN
ncbi:MAG: hypothetical protein GXO12_00615 [Epsilonproteobacteria bacterium]|nr:hypothetical protein [Campylobacterota bacterium]